ncbi:Ribosomal RNA small subunit methyltransferase H [Methylobacterium adhaesivum]|uniref:Ribosomal RNA small subunit methyltransferase H n=1 Tax=Methylobacterium adhaesivum TaxID=333297 RepID=A0ABT8BKY2_9HYPH|nr:16S rRNA (cytosine(1402)-N(4))-methyltransferase RsmH [Methylobacterium adhaesivum]MDN3592162.1 16S rRNA (cytosine(1402)-N(4))-methyltransferase RsmH [Methylobacterium adhaesivum]GJD31549.1 Ribosomal RNA small subunit methyltransferase H [Methylobacterium adhaesivum]
MKRVREARPPSDGAPHVPVLLAEVLTALDLPGRTLAVDGTFGAGGYTRAMLSVDPSVHVLAIDRDPGAIADGAPLVAAAQGRLTLVPGRFGTLDACVRNAGHPQADAVVLDIGVSSMQIDQAERGFSFRHDGPLDMRMERAGRSAADLVNEAEEGELADIIYHYGEERRSRAVARAIVEARRKGRIETTAALAEVVSSVVWADPASGIHPATRTFQGLRIAVNDELGELVQALHAAERILRPGGRLAVVTFHSLEDRIVKQFFSARSGRAAQGSRHLPSLETPAPRSFTAVTKGPVLPTDSETFANPRARSAKLRAVERTDAPAPAPLAVIETLAALPERTGRSARR